MKNKAIIYLIAVCILLVSLSASLVACNPAKIEKVVGTYQLVLDTRTKYEQETVDNIEAYGREAYLVVTGDDYGYYVYKDDDTPAFARKVKLEYSENDKNEITSVSFILGEGERSNSFFVDSNKETMLISRWRAATKLTDAYDIEYKKISKATDLSVVQKLYNDMPVFDYDLYQFNGMFYTEIDNGLQKNFSEYIYKYYLVDSATCKATLYYALKQDKTPVVQIDLAVSFERNDDTARPVTMTIGNDKYDLASGTPTRPVSVSVDGTIVDVNETMTPFYPDSIITDYNEYFNELISAYEESLKDESQE